MLRIALQRNFADFSARVRGRAGGGITCLQIIPQALQLDEDASAAVDMLDWRMRKTARPEALAASLTVTIVGKMMVSWWTSYINDAPFFAIFAIVGMYH